MKISIKELQNIETDMLKEIISICEANNINYFLSYGSVLGAVRHEGPIPWDNDMDIAIPFSELSLFLEKMRENLPEKYYVDFHDTNPKYVNFFPRIGLKDFSTKILHVDIYLLTGAPESQKDQNIFKNKADKLKLLIQYKNLKEGYFAFHKISLKAKIAIYLKAFQMLFVSKNQLIDQANELCSQYSYIDSNTVVNIFGGYKMKEFIPKDYLGVGSKLKYANLE